MVQESQRQDDTAVQGDQPATTDGEILVKGDQPATTDGEVLVKPGGADEGKAFVQGAAEGKPLAGSPPAKDQPVPDGEPAHEEEPMKGSEPAPEEEPTKADAPAPEEEPAKGEAPATEGEPAKADVPAPEEEPAKGEAPATEGEPAKADVPAPEAEPTKGEAPAAEGEPAKVDTPRRVAVQGADEAAAGAPQESPAEASPAGSPAAATGDAEIKTPAAANGSPTTAPAADSVEAAIEAVLPEDAPKGHVAWEQVRFCSHHKYPYALMQYGTGADRIRFQATMMASGSQENAMRIVRASWMLFESGAGAEEVKKFRNDIIERVKQVKDKFAAQGSAKSVKEPARPAAAEQAGGVNGAAAKRTAADGPAKAEAPKDAGKPKLTDDGRDAAPDTAAHAKVRYDKGKEYHFFTIPGLEKERRVFTVSDKRFGTPFEECQRVARVCFAHFEAGWPKDDVVLVRDEMLQKVFDEVGASKKATPEAARLEGAKVEAARLEAAAKQEASKPDPLKLKRKSSLDLESRKSSVDFESDAAEKPPLKEAKVDGQEPAKEEQKPQQDAKDAPNASPALEPPFIKEDAPADSEAHTKVKLKRSTNCCCFKYKHADGTDGHYQATIKAAGGDIETAMRIARLMYVKVEQGASKEEVEAYRVELYARCQSKQAGAAPPADGAPEEKKRSKKRKREEPEGEAAGGKEKKEKQKKPHDQTSTLLQQLQTQGRLAGALRVEGRNTSAKNASINGLYAVVAGGFGASQAYEKVGAGSARYLFYSVKKKRWMINDELDDAKRGFAFAKIQDGGKAAPAEHGSQLRWQVFNGKEDGYVEDPAVRCVALANDKPEGKDAKEKKAAKDKAAIERKASTVSEADQIAKGESDDEESGESDSSSSSSGSDAEDDADNSPQGGDNSGAAAAPAANGAAALASSASAANLAPTVPPGVRRSTGRVCAKMLVTSGLRCPCHFAPRRECPGAAR